MKGRQYLANHARTECVRQAPHFTCAARLERSEVVKTVGNGGRVINLCNLNALKVHVSGLEVKQRLARGQEPSPRPPVGAPRCRRVHVRASRPGLAPVVLVVRVLVAPADAADDGRDAARLGPAARLEADLTPQGGARRRQKKDAGLR
jgi:hypothetical protein